MMGSALCPLMAQRRALIAAAAAGGCAAVTAGLAMSKAPAPPDARITRIGTEDPRMSRYDSIHTTPFFPCVIVGARVPA